ncbi:C1q and tumor necrosis factor protein 2 [Mactra antiquata]
MWCVHTFVILLLVHFAYSKHSVRSAETLASENFSAFIIEELNKLKDFQKYAENKIADLEKENHKKDMKITKLETEISSMKDGNVHNVLKSRHRRVLARQLAFTAYLSSSMTHSGTIRFNKVLLNDGNGYDASTGEFTATVSGVYLFSFSVGAKQTNGTSVSQYDVFTRLVVNGVHQLSAVAESKALHDDEQGSSTAIIFALEGDKISVMLENRGGTLLYADNFERVSSFTGTLLYETGGNSMIVG